MLPVREAMQKKIIDYFYNHASIKISLIVCNKEKAGVINIAAQNNIPVLMIEKEKFFREDSYVDELFKAKINAIILAGFLWKIPSKLIAAFPEKIINIHPALLPKFGGKGMYGNFVHEAVIASKETESGITIHLVDDVYDHGKIIFQKKCAVTQSDTSEDVAKKIHLLEHEFYPQVIEEFIKENLLK